MSNNIWKVSQASSTSVVWESPDHPNRVIIQDLTVQEYQFYTQTLENGRYISGEVDTFETLKEAIESLEPEAATSWDGTDDGLEKALVEKSKELLIRACQKYNIAPAGRKLSSLFTLTGARAGCASWYTNENGVREYSLNFNIALARRDFSTIFNQVTGHEVAHIINLWLHPLDRDWHGYNWQKIMVECFGLMPDRCHRIDTTGIARRLERVHMYQCPTCKHVYNLKPGKHSKIASGKRWVACSNCHVRLNYIGKKEMQLGWNFEE